MKPDRIGLEVFTIFCVVAGLAVATEGTISDAYAQENPCSGKHGVFLPKPGVCSEYFVCVQGLAVLGSCGDNHFNARQGVCDLPSKAGCINYGPEPLTLTDSVCFDKKDGTKLPVDDDASKYYLCEQGRAQFKDCGSKLTFDRAVQECVGVIPKPALKQLLPPCSGVRNGARVPVAYDPRKYYLCMNNRPFLKSCGDLFFSAKTSSCSLERDAEEQAKEQTVGAPISSVAELRPAAVLTPPAEPLERPNQVATLVESRPVRIGIAPRPKPSVEQQQPMIKQSRPIEIGVASPPKNASVHKDHLAQRICRDQRIGSRIAIPGSCSHYYICMGNMGILKNCGESQFNPEIAACDLASNVLCRIQQGSAVYGPEGAAGGTLSQQSNDAAICQGQRDGALLPAFDSCSEYFFCLKSSAIRKTCGQRHFSPITTSCVDVKESKCVDKNLVAPKPIVRQDTDEANCLNRADGVLLKHPTDCGKFLICDHHKPVEMICPAGLHFNVNQNYCDWPELAKCA